MRTIKSQAIMPQQATQHYKQVRQQQIEPQYYQQKSGLESILGNLSNLIPANNLSDLRDLSNLSKLTSANNNTYLPMALVTPEGQIQSYNPTSSSEAQDARYFNNIMQNYLSSKEGQNFSEYVSEHGKEPIKIIGFGADKMEEGVIAALKHDGELGVIVGNYTNEADFEGRIQKMANRYKIQYDAALEYVLTHELGHAAGYLTETTNEEFIGDYFTQRSQKSKEEGNLDDHAKYASLAKIAYERSEQSDD